MASPPDLDVPRATLENLVGQPIGDPSLYRRALTHRSLLRRYPNRDLQSNERLEFLGDAFLDLVVGEVLYDRFPDRDEGDLSRLRARLVSEAPLARYARRMNLGRHLLMSDNAAADNGRDNPTILADAFEALTGAVYLDRGHDAARQFIHDRVFAPFDLDALLAQDTNYKSQLLEHMQADGRPQPTYRVVEEVGPSHDKTFTVEAWVGDTALGQGTGSSKQDAEQRAARDALAHLRTDASA
jgi:ribonuclease-3